MFKKVLVLLFVGLNLLFGSDMCDIPDDIKARYENEIKKMKEIGFWSVDKIKDYKKETLGDVDYSGNFGRGSYWNSGELKNGKYPELYIAACAKKEKYYRQAYDEIMQGKGKCRYKLHKYDVNAEWCIQKWAYDLETLDNL